MKYIKFSYFFLLIFFFIGCAELDKIVKEIEIKPIKPNNTQKTSPKKTSPPKKAANTFIDFKKIFRQNAKEKATKTTAQQKVIPLNNLKVTDKVVIKDVFVYEGKTSRKSCENYFLFIEQTTKTELRSGNVRVTDNGKQCIYEAGAKKIIITEVRQMCSIPILQKDFILEEYQIIEARSIGADAILLIAAALSPQKLYSLAKFARNLELEVLLEVHCLEELEKYLTTEINLVGVNNRNLKTFEVSIQNSLDLIEKIPAHYCKLSESGLTNIETILQLKKAGFDGFLIGETFMKTKEPKAALNDLLVRFNEIA